MGSRSPRHPVALKSKISPFGFELLALFRFVGAGCFYADKIDFLLPIDVIFEMPYSESTNEDA